MTTYPHLFSPYELGPFKLKNRLGHASVTTRFVDKGVVTQRYIDFYRNRGAGGASILVGDPYAVHKRQLADPRRATPLHQEGLDGLKRLGEAMASVNSHFLYQTQDHGRGSHEGMRRNGAISASALPDDLSLTVPHAMTPTEIEDLIDEMATSAAKLKEAGLSGTEISAGHGHFFHQFLSRRSNIREDAYGGDVEGRTKLLRDLIAEIRSRCGAEFLIGVKLPGEDFTPGGVDLEDAADIAARVAADGGFDYWTFCWGSHSDTLYTHLPDAFGERGPYLEKIKQLRQVAPDVPTGALGYMTDPNEGEHAIETGIADIAFYGRPLVTDAAFGLKAEQGREAEIRYCVSCNTCWHSVINGNAIACDNNPRAGEPDEIDWIPPKASNKQRIVIVGTGIAGMEAGWIAAARGHEVIQFGTSENVGGKTRLHAELPGGENYSSIYDYQFLKGNQHGVKYEFGALASLDDITGLSPDKVILATGARLSVPDFIPAEYAEEGLIPDLREMSADLLQKTERQPGAAVIFDLDHTEMTYAAAQYFCDLFDRVVIVTPRERIASDVSLMARQGIYARLYKRHVKIYESSTLDLSELEEGVVSVVNIFNGDKEPLEDMAALTYATPRLPNEELAAPLREAGLKVLQVGDCFTPGVVLNATRTGYEAGLKV